MALLVNRLLLRSSHKATSSLHYSPGVDCVTCIGVGEYDRKFRWTHGSRTKYATVHLLLPICAVLARMPSKSVVAAHAYLCARGPFIDDPGHRQVLSLFCRSSVMCLSVWHSEHIAGVMQLSGLCISGEICPSWAQCTCGCHLLKSDPLDSHLLDFTVPSQQRHDHSCSQSQR